MIFPWYSLNTPGDRLAVVFLVDARAFIFQLEIRHNSENIFIIGGTKWCNCGALVVFGAMVVQLSVMVVKWYNNQLLYQINFLKF